MPWDAADTSSHNKSAGRTSEGRARWAAVANSVRAQALKKPGASEQKADAKAAKVANGVLKESETRRTRDIGRGMPPKRKK